MCWVFVEQTQIFSGIQFTRYCIDFFVVETKRFVDSSVTVILARQTCGQRSSRAAESKRRALGNYFPEWMCYMFQISKWRDDWDLDRCTFWVLAKREPLRNGDVFRKKRVSPAENIGSWHCAAVFFSQVPAKCTDPNLDLLYILILGTYSKIARENKFLVFFPRLLSADMLDGWPQICRFKITFTQIPTNRFVP